MNEKDDDLNKFIKKLNQEHGTDNPPAHDILRKIRDRQAREPSQWLADDNDDNYRPDNSYTDNLVARLRAGSAELSEAIMTVNALVLWNYIQGVVHTTTDTQEQVIILMGFLNTICEELPDYSAKTIYKNLNDRTC